MKKMLIYTVINCLLLFCWLQNIQATAQSINKDEFAARRQQLMNKMEGGIAVFKSANVAARNSDVDYEFRQDSDFYYLTGFEEPESAFLLIPGAEQKFIMFVRKRNPLKEMWTGKQCGVEGAMKIYAADTAYTIDQFEKMLPQLLMGKEKIYYNMNDEIFNNTLLSIMKRRWGYNPKKINKPPKHLIDPSPLVHEMRLIKSACEIEQLKRSIEITCDAHIEAMKAITPGIYEYEVEAIIEYIYRKNDCPRVAFPSIIGSGPNSTILHYDASTRQTENGDLILMDIGSEYKYYAADITRTVPVNGKFSKAQQDIYEIVLASQEAAIHMMTPGVGLEEVKDKITEVIKDGLFRLGLITDTESKWQYRTWYPHGPSHWLGLDVHDAGSYLGADTTRGRILEPGIVLTVEPGIYVRAVTLDNLMQLKKMFKVEVADDDIQRFIDAVRPVANKYNNIGVRIEDDVLITKNGHEVLSVKAPKEINAIEAMMKKNSYITH